MKWEYKVIEVERGYSEENIEKQLNDKKYASWELVSIGSHLDLLGFQKIWADSSAQSIQMGGFNFYHFCKNTIYA